LVALDVREEEVALPSLPPSLGAPDGPFEDCIAYGEHLEGREGGRKGGREGGEGLVGWTKRENIKK